MTDTKTRSRRTFCTGMAAVAAATVLGGSGQSLAAGRPMSLVVPYPPGGSTDILGRLFAEAFGTHTGERMIVENKPGANGNIGAGQVALAEKDGRTLLYTFGNLLLNQQFMLQDTKLRPLDDLVPVIRTCVIQAVIVASAASPAKDLGEFIAMARKNPGKHSYAYFGDITSAAIAAGAGIDLLRVPYKGGLAGMTDVMGGLVDIINSSYAQAQGSLKSGRLKALAVTGDQRLADFPDVPTIKEVIPGFRAIDYQVVLAPKGTSQAVVEDIYRKSLDILTTPEMQKQFRERGAIVSPMRPDELRAYMAADQASIAAVVRAAGIQPE